MDYNQPSHQHPQTPLDGSQNMGNLAKRNGDSLRSLLSAVGLMAAALVIAFSVAAFVIQSYQVDGESMESTLQHNDRLIVNKVPRTWARITKNPYIPNRGDIIVFNQMGVFDIRGSDNKQLIKRVVGLPGERVVVENGTIMVYSDENPAGFNPDIDGGYEIERTNSPGKVALTLNSDEIFVAGDNRPNSEDSRYFGAVKSDHIVGKLVMRILPANNAKRF